jgi:hypothetical protein
VVELSRRVQRHRVIARVGGAPLKEIVPPPAAVGAASSAWADR